MRKPLWLIGALSWLAKPTTPCMSNRLSSRFAWLQLSRNRVCWSEAQKTGCRAPGQGYRVQGTGYRVQGTGYRVPGTGYLVLGTGCVHYDQGVWVKRTGYRVKCTGYGEWGTKDTFRGTGPTVQSDEVESLGSWVQGTERGLWVHGQGTESRVQNAV